ncbi:META domain-containing protein [Roseicyclus marinus]|uniref:HslJ n=1 Tax=Roseicyclus marinus TaxID=2161673 RepID=A0AA48KND6_9RHOB|nr:HslJ [Roseicyclus marinus]
MIRAALALCLMLSAGAALADQRLTGSVTYRDRIALPQDAVLVVELTAPDGRLLAEARVPSDGRQVPIPFSLEVPGEAVGILRAGLMLGAVAEWLGEPVVLDGAMGDLGEIGLVRHEAGVFPASYRCGDLPLRVGAAEGNVVLDTGRDWVVMAPVPAASGARYEVSGQAETYFWDRAGVAQVALDGVALPECRASLPPEARAYRGRGNEPFWSVEIASGQMVLRRLGMEDVILPVTESALTAEGALRVTAGDAVLRRKPAICRDSMTGMPYPETLAVAMGDQVLQGCGGLPEDLLRGAWRVESIAGDPVIADSRLTLGFGADGRVAGSGGCNRWFAGYDLTGEGLAIGQAGATMMACPEPIMAQEQRFFAALAQVTGFDIDGTGGLVLLAMERPILIMRAAQDRP